MGHICKPGGVVTAGIAYNKIFFWDCITDYTAAAVHSAAGAGGQRVARALSSCIHTGITHQTVAVVTPACTASSWLARHTSM